MPILSQPGLHRFHTFHSDRVFPLESYWRKRLCIFAQLRKPATIIERGKSIDEFGQHFEKLLGFAAGTTKGQSCVVSIFRESEYMKATQRDCREQRDPGTPSS